MDSYQPCIENGPSEEEEIVLTQPTYGGMEGCGAADDVDAYYDHVAGCHDGNKMINDDRSCRVGKDEAT